mmetsp:Transcript_51138/g.121525  ORF Transcript_51138/g.121525 Transcript_51138/m.121525 type:complete len:353 (+) Transcript_51138:112-1170(+)|eukprot:CAMPEP_0178443416 /NCGR_PEP_ID=MMETSP0689_2-20121128/38887_1 /TAXON_ID=160604 /ORGANISM="Amphidinium massartii, Strain CS-259" /LENGTH=352 /DNA_ID=CAMNT_0020067429 /DNA_START=47 /DNA_END=1105 /DNA_ORIENTATION=+
MARVLKLISMAGALLAGCAAASSPATQLIPMPHKLQKGLKGHQQQRRRLISEDGVSGIWVNELKNNIKFGFPEDRRLMVDEEIPFDLDVPVDFFELIWGPDVNISDITLTLYDATEGGMTLVSLPIPPEFELFSDFDGFVYFLPMLIILPFPEFPDVLGISISKTCDEGTVGEVIECISFGDSFTAADGTMCESTGVMDPSFHGEVLVPFLADEEEFDFASVSRKDFCPHGEWSLQPFSPLFFNPEQLDYIFGLGKRFTGFTCPLPACAPATPTPEVVCLSCKEKCEKKLGMELEPAPSNFGFLEITRGRRLEEGAPNCDPSAGGQWCCVHSDLNNNKIYERDAVRCFCSHL